MAKRSVELVLELVARSAGPRSARAAPLDHEARDHAVELEPVVVPARREVDEVRHRDRRLLGEQVQLDGALGGRDRGLHGVSPAGWVGYAAGTKRPAGFRSSVRDCRRWGRSVEASGPGTANMPGQAAKPEPGTGFVRTRSRGPRRRSSGRSTSERPPLPYTAPPAPRRLWIGGGKGYLWCSARRGSHRRDAAPRRRGAATERRPRRWRSWRSRRGAAAWRRRGGMRWTTGARSWRARPAGARWTTLRRRPRRGSG